MPLGSGAIAGHDLRHRHARRWPGASASPAWSPNSLDASSDRDFVASFLYACSLAMVHLSRLAEDLIIFTSEEFGFFELPDRFATGSSLMPQKKNPDPLELVRGKSGRVLGRLTGWLTTMKGLPSGYNRDLQEDKEAVFDAEATLASSLDACAAVVAGLHARTARGPRPRRRACCWPPTWPTTSWRAACPSATPTRLSARSCGQLVAEGRDFASLTLGRVACASATGSGRRRGGDHRRRRRWRPSGRRSPPTPMPCARRWTNFTGLTVGAPDDSPGGRLPLRQHDSAAEMSIASTLALLALAGPADLRHALA